MALGLRCGSSILLMTGLMHAADLCTIKEKSSDDTSVTYSGAASIVVVYLEDRSD
jgi:hypothetical protein